jgi:hypothetical protein
MRQTLLNHMMRDDVRNVESLDGVARSNTIIINVEIKEGIKLDDYKQNDNPM